VLFYVESYHYTSPQRLESDQIADSSRRGVYRNVYTPSSVRSSERQQRADKKLSQRKLKKLHELFVKSDKFKNSIRANANHLQRFNKEIVGASICFTIL
jgi:hypothetical protein